MKWNSTVVTKHLTTNVFADWCCSIKLQKHVCLQQVLCTFNFTCCNHRAETHPFALNIEQHIFALHWIANEIYAPQAGILVASVEGLEAVAQSWQTKQFIQVLNKYFFLKMLLTVFSASAS